MIFLGYGIAQLRVKISLFFVKIIFSGEAPLIIVQSSSREEPAQKKLNAALPGHASARDLYDLYDLHDL